MKHKLIAIIENPCDSDIKADLIQEYMMHTCNEFLTFSANRNELLIDQHGLIGFAEDCTATSKEQIWEYFKNYLIEKEKIHVA